MALLILRFAVCALFVAGVGRLTWHWLRRYERELAELGYPLNLMNWLQLDELRSRARLAGQQQARAYLEQVAHLEVAREFIRREVEREMESGASFEQACRTVISGKDNR